MSSAEERARLAALLAPAMHEAGRRIEHYRQHGYTIEEKPGRNGAPPSPVTDADRAAEALLLRALAATDPGATIVAEERVAAEGPPAPARRFWLVDALDGTSGFVRGGHHYSVNVALVEDGAPVLGLLLHPPTDILWTGITGLGAEVARPGQDPAPIHGRAFAPSPVAVVSHARLDRQTRLWVASIPGCALQPSASSLKFTILAEGGADLYPRCTETSEWDTGAGDALLRAAGGMTYGADGRPFRYGKKDYRNGGFVALGDPDAFARLPPFRC